MTAETAYPRAHARRDGTHEHYHLCPQEVCTQRLTAPYRRTMARMSRRGGIGISSGNQVVLPCNG